VLQVNLLPWRTRQYRQRCLFAALLAGILLLIVLMVLPGIYFYVSKQTEYFSQLRQQQEQAHHALQLQWSARQQALEQWQQQQLAQQVEQQQWQQGIDVLLVLQQITALLPAEIALSVFDAQPQGVILQGNSASYQGIIRFTEALSHQGILQAVLLQEMHQLADGRLAFSLRAKLASLVDGEEDAEDTP
jgi:Tfp pilus assembly protein PilN